MSHHAALAVVALFVGGMYDRGSGIRHGRAIG